MSENKYKAVVIGGSWGGFEAINKILSGLSKSFSLPIILILHRLKGLRSDLPALLQRSTSLKVKEIDEKEKIKKGTVYLAPADYHVLVEDDHTFSLDASEPKNHSRPSIDVGFESASDVYKDELVGVVLSGASKDGSKGLAEIEDKGGQAVVQDPSEAKVDTMPRAAIKKTKHPLVLKLQGISDYLNRKGSASKSKT